MHIHLDIAPRPKQSVRSKIIWVGGKPRIKTYPDPELVAYQNEIGYLLRKQLPFGYRPLANAVVIENLTFVFKAPKSLKKKYKLIIQEYESGISTKPLFRKITPDFDNLSKPLMDACNKLLFKDDCLVVKVTEIITIYGNSPHISFDVRSINSDGYETS